MKIQRTKPTVTCLRFVPVHVRGRLIVYRYLQMASFDFFLLWTSLVAYTWLIYKETQKNCFVRQNE